ncbi:MAG: hypothetical protein ABJE95_32505 [Byssovorax sp.]
MSGAPRGRRHVFVAPTRRRKLGADRIGVSTDSYHPHFVYAAVHVLEIKLDE